MVGEAGDGAEAEAMVRALRPEVLVTDIEMPRRSGLELAQAVKDLPTRVVILTTFGRSGYLRRALEAGALGYLRKDAPSAELAAALGLAEGTVRNYLSEAISKLGAGNRVEAARVARERGWL